MSARLDFPEIAEAAQCTAAREGMTAGCAGRPRAACAYEGLLLAAWLRGWDCGRRMTCDQPDLFNTQAALDL